MLFTHTVSTLQPQTVMYLSCHKRHTSSRLGRRDSTYSMLDCYNRVTRSSCASMHTATGPASASPPPVGGSWKAAPERFVFQLLPVANCLTGNPHYPAKYPAKQSQHIVSHCPPPNKKPGKKNCDASLSYVLYSRSQTKARTKTEK
jgi:hypothetical protein